MHSVMIGTINILQLNRSNQHLFTLGMPPTLSPIPFKSFHTSSTKRPITLVSELNIKKETPCCVAKSFDPNIKRDARKAPRGIPNLY